MNYREWLDWRREVKLALQEVIKKWSDDARILIRSSKNERTDTLKKEEVNKL